MKHGRKLFMILLVGSAFALSSCISLASDITPPPGNTQSDSGQPSVAAEPVIDLIEGAYPLQQPDVENGALIYAEKCEPCHGERGWGDGPDAALLEVPVAAIGTSEFKDVSSPLAWYTMVTKGNIQKFMPPFSSLTDQERWDVVAYAFSLHDVKILIPMGEPVFVETCAECHGEDGNLGNENAALIGSQEYMASLSNMDIAAAVMKGFGPGTHVFGDNLTDDELAGLVYYVRTLTLPYYGFEGVAADIEPTEVADAAEDTAEDDTAEDAATEDGETTEDTADATEDTADAAEALTTMTITGQIINASGAVVPAGLEVTLLAYDHMDEVANVVITSDENGQFVFEGVELVAERLYFTIVDYDGVTYNSEMITGDATISEYETSVEVYDTTTSTENLVVDRLHVFFDFQKADVVRVFLVYLVSNNGTEAVVSGDPSVPVMQYVLPEGASNIFFQDEATANSAVSLGDENGFGDVRPVQPGASSYQMLFGYEMAYDDGLEFAQPVNLPVDALLVFLPQGPLDLVSDQLESIGIEDINGAFYESFEGGQMEAGSSLILSLEGEHPGGVASPSGDSASASPAISLGDQTELIYGGVALLIVLGSAVFWLMRRNTGADWEDDPESVMDAIIDLDETYEEGDMDEAVYHARRAELKELLEELLDEDE